MGSKPLYLERFIGVHADRRWPTVRAIVTPPTGGTEKVGANADHVAYSLHKGAGLPRYVARAVVQRLVEDKRLVFRKYGKAWWVYEAPPVLALGPKRIRARVLGAEGVAQLRRDASWL